MEEQEGRAGASGNVVHADAVDAGASVEHRVPVVIEGLWHNALQRCRCKDEGQTGEAHR